ncbi:8-amino-7-oxononanoate synthase [Candidatus Termititenax aidoneus]|uniref:8-amino-7-oxononanoate synthase n=1 Tax=Termititenax aidoneus TaxID=2218524 RepID=A0A388TBF4_TERA1|nr:8-amino-7-oxononanoate synthase [Candidatus Termititenax aidoneus]
MARMDLAEFLTGALAELDQKNLLRRLPDLQNIDIGFSRNTYLGNHFGASGSRLISGNHRLYARLERELSLWKKTAAALVYPAGYMTNLGVISALLDRGDLIILDKLCHASLIDGARLAQADIRVFKHNNPADLEKILRQSRNYKKILVVTESVFSMDGDRAPLAELTALRRQYGFWLLVDEAHAVGVFGESGEGLAGQLGMNGDIDIQIGTFSKAFDGLGGYVCGSRLLIDYLVNKSRAFIYTTALPKIILRKNLANLKKVQSKKQRRKLWKNINYFSARLGIRADSAIIPLLIGDEKKALALAEKLRDEGFIIPAIRYPTVPRGQARLRLTISAETTKRQMNKLLALLNQRRKNRALK